MFNDEHWFIPFEWGQTSTTCHTDLFDLQGDAESRGGRYAGRLSTIVAAEDSWWRTAIYAGVDTDNLTDETIQKVFDLLAQQHKLFLFRQSDMTTVEQALASGAYRWPDLQHRMARRSGKIAVTRHSHVTGPMGPG